MTRVGNVDQLLLLLREQLQRSERSRAAVAPRKGRSRDAATGPLERARALASLGGLSELEVRRAVVRGLLAERFGERLASDPGFQPVMGEVMRIIEESEEARELVTRVIVQLKGSD